LAFLVPTPYQQYPRLTGRATAEFTVEKGDGSSFTVATGGGPQKVGILEVVLDGYSAPLTAGNFADLVMYVCTFACFEKLNGMGWGARKS
jgi:hypothetical protein